MSPDFSDVTSESSRFSHLRYLVTTYAFIPDNQPIDQSQSGLAAATRIHLHSGIPSSCVPRLRPRIRRVFLRWFCMRTGAPDWHKRSLGVMQNGHFQSTDVWQPFATVNEGRCSFIKTDAATAPPNQNRDSHEDGHTSVIAGFRVHQAPHTGNICENAPKVGSSQLLLIGVLSFCHFDSRVDLASSKQPFFWGKGGLSRHHPPVVQVRSGRQGTITPKNFELRFPINVLTSIGKFARHFMDQGMYSANYFGL